MGSKAGIVLYLLGWCICLAAIGVTVRGGDEKTYWKLTAGIVLLLNIVFTVPIPAPMGTGIVPIPFPDAVVMVGIDVLIIMFPFVVILFEVSLQTAYWWSLPVGLSFLVRSHMLRSSNKMIKSQVKSYQKEHYLTPRVLRQTALLGQVPIVNIASAVISNLFLWKNIKHQLTSDGIDVDIWTPPSGCQNKVMLFLHGGAWIGGSHRWQAPAVFLHRVCQSGYTIVSCGYQKGKWPTQLVDSAKTLLWIKQTFKPKKIIISGASAGGHIAALLTAIVSADGSFNPPKSLSNVSNILSEQNIKIAGYVGWYPAFSPGDNILVSIYFKLFVCRNEKVDWQGIDPSRILSPNFPPSLLFHGTSDSVVPIIQSEVFFTRLAHTRKNSSDMFLRLPYMRHTFEILASESSSTVMDVSVAWMDDIWNK